MIYEKFNFKPLKDSYEEIFGSEIKRLQSILQARLNLLNIFKPLTNKTHAPITFKNININTESEYEIINFIAKNTKHIEDFYRNHMDGWFMENGTEWQKSRVLMGEKLKGIVSSA